MKKIMSRKVFEAISVLTIMTFFSSFCLPAAMAGAIQQNDRREQLSKFILDLTGGCAAEQILSILKTTISISDDKADEILLALNGLLETTLYSGSKIKPAQSSACTDATVLFMTGLTSVLVSIIISNTVTQETCVNQECLGELCICTKEETTSPLSGVNHVLRGAGNVMILLGSLGYIENCLLSPAGSVVDNNGITR